MPKYPHTVENCPHCKGQPLPRLNIGRHSCNLCGNTSDEPIKGYMAPGGRIVPAQTNA